MNSLTKREIQIMHLIISGHSKKQIAEQLNYSIRTIETHRKNIYRKLNCNSAMSLMKWALEKGIFERIEVE